MKAMMITVLLFTFYINGYAQLSSFSWLEGEWRQQMANGKQRIETWKKSANDLFVGKGLKVSAKDSLLMESLELSYKDNNVWYIPTVPDQNNAEPVPFKLVKSTSQEFTFENPDHDFPQRIFYQYRPSSGQQDIDSLYVRVESLDGKGIDYKFKRL